MGEWGMKKRIVFFMLVYMIVNNSAYAEPILNFFLYPYPYTDEIQEHIKQPGRVASHIVDSAINRKRGVGVFSTYHGYIDITNSDGQTFYPRRHPTDTVHLVVTDIIIPITMFANTVDHWELNSGTPAAFYKLEKKQDEQTKLFIWDVQPEKRPADNVIPREALILIADPHTIHVPTGVTEAEDSPHLLLPPIYVKKGLDTIKSAVYMIAISHLFGPSRVLYTKEEKRYVMHTR